MRNLFFKELKLAASPLSFCFIGFGLMFFFPGYPILCGAFFITLGIFQGFLHACGANDILFTALLPVNKSDVVKAKFLFASFIECCGFIVMMTVTLIRMTVWKDAIAYRSNALMNANFFALAIALCIFGIFNFIFIGGFFKTAYRFTAPFIEYSIISFLIIGGAETAHHIPALSALNAFGYDHIFLQSLILLGGIALFLCLTFGACRRSIRRFDAIDL